MQLTKNNFGFPRDQEARRHSIVINRYAIHSCQMDDKWHNVEILNNEQGARLFFFVVMQIIELNSSSRKLLPMLIKASRGNLMGPP